MSFQLAGGLFLQFQDGKTAVLSEIFESVAMSGESFHMRIAILSRGPRLYSTRRLVEEGCKRGLDIAVLDPLKFGLTIGTDGVEILHRGEPVAFDAAIPRIGHSITRHGVALLNQFEQLGLYSANTGDSIRKSRDKLLASQILAKNGIRIPTTAYVRDLYDVETAIERVGGLPCIIKVSEGTQGQGVFLRHTLRESMNLVEALLLTGKAVLIQQYIAESHGKDIRALVVGDRVVAAMRRRARGREFRSNFHLNGTVESVELNEEYVNVARRAARVLGLNIAGVDLLEGADGPLVLEVNSSPGLQGIEAASGVNVAGYIIDFLIKDVDFADVDVGQLLRTNLDQGVLSLHLKHHPRLVGRSILELFSLGADIPVFALARGNDLLWNPDPELQLRFDDILICYGEFTALRQALKSAIGKGVLPFPVKAIEDQDYEGYNLT
jgi:ribosomal protein S6--L-glutamate ligase